MPYNFPLEVTLKTFISVMLLLVPLVAVAALPRPADVRGELNATPYGSRVQLGTQLVDKAVHLMRARYDFSKQGGAVGTVDLLDVDGKKAQLPPGAIIQDCVVVVRSGLVSGGSATISASSGKNLQDLKGVTAHSALATSDQLAACIPTAGSLASAIKLPEYTKGFSLDYTPTLTIGGAALTAGKLDLLIKYIISQ